MDTLSYTIVPRLAMPELDGERRYLRMERELAERELEKLPRRSWLPFSYPGLGLLRREDWRRYIQALDRYEHDLDELAEEIDDGLTPLEFNVIYEGERPDSRVRVELTVEHGSIHASKKVPSRPKRVDGAPNKSTKKHWHGFSGFLRRGIHIGRKRVRAEFSGLRAQDCALVVNQALYVEIGRFTKIKYKIRSRNVPDGMTGEVELD
jgi:hypothetical protein